jgi:ssDNA-binding Zn-finger/Zn-ribbon topoisomerase 1
MIMKYNDLQECASCGKPVQFAQGTSNIWVIANVYVDCDHTDHVCRLCLGYGRRWDRIEHWHEACYDEDQKPYGETEFRKTKVVSKSVQ